MAENGFQFRWSDDEDQQIEQDLEKIPRPLWHNLLDLGLIVLTVVAQIIVGRIWPQLIIFDGWSYLVIVGVALFGIYLLLDRFFPEGLRGYLTVFLVLAFVLPRGRPGNMIRAIKKLNVMQPWTFTITLAASCISSIPIAYFKSYNKLWLFSVGLFALITYTIIAVTRKARREYTDRKAQEKQELLEQQKREEMGRWR